MNPIPKNSMYKYVVLDRIKPRDITKNDAVICICNDLSCLFKIGQIPSIKLKPHRFTSCYIYTDLVVEHKIAQFLYIHES